MTDARFPERWLIDRRLLGLSDAAFRAFVVSLAWSVGNRTEGVLDGEDLRLIPDVDSDRVAELVAAGLWVAEREHWQIRDFDATQTGRGELERLESLRKKQTEKKRRQRSRGTSRGTPSRVTVPGDGTRTGQARPGQAQAP
jgi:hypothetical protein